MFDLGTTFRLEFNLFFSQLLLIKQYSVIVFFLYLEFYGLNNFRHGKDTSALVMLIILLHC